MAVYKVRRAGNKRRTVAFVKMPQPFWCLAVGME